jgi:hypothetical protein
MPREIEQIKTTFQEIIENIDFYAEKLVNDYVFGFKKISLSYAQQLEIMTLLGDRLNWVPNSRDKIEFTYTEDHSWGIQNVVPFGDNDIIIDWHLEHINYRYAQISGFWNMVEFSCPKSSGSTGFVNVITIFESMPDEWKNFLHKCKIINYSRISEEYGHICFYSNGAPFRSFVRNAIQKHPYKEIYVPRLDTRGWTDIENQELYLVDDMTPTKIEINMFAEINQYMVKNVWDNKDIQMWWNWDRGDALMHDVFSLTHSARGGFSLGQRVFCGMWGFPNVEEVTNCSREFLKIGE